MKDTKNVKMLSVLEWAKIIWDKYGNAIAIKYLSRVDQNLADDKAFAPCCFFAVMPTDKDRLSWIEINDYAQWVIGNTDENITKEILLSSDDDEEEEEEELGFWVCTECGTNCEDASDDSFCEEEESLTVEDIIDELVNTEAWKKTIATLMRMYWAWEAEVIKNVKAAAHKDTNWVARLTGLLNKVKSLGL